MAHHSSPEEKQILKLIEKLTVPEETRNTWVSEIQGTGLTEEIAEGIRKVLTAVPEGEADTAGMSRGRMLVEFTTLVKRWRLADQSRHFGRR